MNLLVSKLALVAFGGCPAVLAHGGESYTFEPLEVPFKDDKAFSSNVNRRQKWCKVDGALVAQSEKQMSSLSFVHGLENKTINVVFVKNDMYLQYNESTKTLEGGFFAEVLDQACGLAGVRWRDSFAIVDPPNSSTGVTYDDLLQWAVANYDVVVGDFSGTAERRALGLKFGFPLLDESPVLATVAKDTSMSLVEQAFSIHRPFGNSLWVAIFALFFCTAGVYYWLEHEHTDFKDWRNTNMNFARYMEEVSHSLWLTMSAFTGGGTFSPGTGPGKAVSLTWTCTVMLLIAAYTANLASLLVVQGAATVQITGVEDAVSKHVPVCVYQGGAFDKMVQSRYPNLQVVYPEVWGYDNLRTGVCGAVVKDRFSFEIDVGKSSANPKCDLVVAGHALLTVSGSFVSRADDSVRCTSMVLDILTVSLQDMYNNGRLASAKKRLMDYQHDQECQTEASTTDHASALNTSAFGGVFAFHFIILVMTALTTCCRRSSSSNREALPQQTPLR